MVTIDSAKLSLDVVVTAKDLDSEIITTSETIRNLTVSMGTISQLKGDKGDPGVSVTHSWNGTVLSLTSASGTTSVDLIGPKGDAGDMDSSVYDSNRNGIVDNAEKVNNHTVELDVPANAKFTDTVYTAGTGILITDGVISNTNVSAIWGNITGNLNNQTDLLNYLNSKADKTYVDSTFQPIGIYLTEVPAEYVTESELLAVQNLIPSITELASEVWVTNQNYLTSFTESDPTVGNHIKSITPTDITNWNTAYTNNHTHSNKTAIDGITAALITNWNTAFTNNHTHGNKAVIDGITSALVSNWNTAFTNNHTHSNKAVLDSLTQAVINNSHTHSNRAALDKITLDVDGNIMIDGNVYSTSGGAGGGIIQTVCGYTGLGDTFSDTDLTNTFNAYTINRLASRLANVESGVLTSVEWSIINGRPSSLSFFTNDCGFVTASIVDGYATQSWVNSNFNNCSLPAASATVLGGVKVGTNLSISSGVLSATNTTYSAATTSVAGLMSAADKAKLEGIAAGANNYTYALPTATAGTLGGVMVGTGLGITSSVLSVTYGTAAGTACRGNDSRLSDARVASDVYAWAKASVKPIYAWTEITSRPTALSSFTNDSGYITASASITGNAATATTLQNSRTIWGQSFDGSGNISGAITGATTITASDVVTVGSLLSTGGITAYTTSDKRLKTNIVDFNAIELIKSMGGIYSFRYTNEAILRDKTLSEHSYGVIALNLQETILSDLVVENNGYLGVNYASPKLISLALKSVIEIDDEIIVLKNKVKLLENKVKQLECRA